MPKKQTVKANEAVRLAKPSSKSNTKKNTTTRVATQKTTKQKTTTRQKQKSSTTRKTKKPVTKRPFLPGSPEQTLFTLYDYVVFGGIILLCVLVFGIAYERRGDILGNHSIGTVSFSFPDGAYKLEGTAKEETPYGTVEKKAYKNTKEMISIVTAEYPSCNISDLIRDYMEKYPDRLQGEYSEDYGKMPDIANSLVVFTNIPEHEKGINDETLPEDKYYTAFIGIDGDVYEFDGQQLQGRSKILRSTIESVIANLK